MHKLTTEQTKAYRAELALLVAAQSVSSVDPAFDQSNRQVLAALDDMARARGGASTWFELPGTLDDSPAAVAAASPAGAATPGAAASDAVAPAAKANLVVGFGTGPGGLVLSGHSDTVPTNPRRWDSDPHILTERDGRLYGLGSADMKAFFPAALIAIERVGVGRLKRQVHLIATADEESTMAGARALMSAGIDLGQAAVVGEPTSLAPIRMHKGVMMLEFELVGRAGHASNPALGINALEGMNALISALLTFREAEFGQLHNADFPVPRPTLNLGAIHGGDSPNRICGACRLAVDVRLLPGQDPDAVLAALTLVAGQAVAGSGCTLNVRPLVAPVPPMHTPSAGALVHLCEHLSGHQAAAVNFATEGPFFNQLGLETVILGAGSIDQAHQPNEFVAWEQVCGLVPILERVIERFCVTCD